MQKDQEEHSLCLTEDEAIGLLDIAMMSPMELTLEQHAAVLKLSEFCRERMRAAEGATLQPTAPFALHPSYAA